MKAGCRIASLCITALLFGGTSLRAQGTAFTYQGKLSDNGAPANGTYDLQFTVYDALTNGNAVAGPITNPATSVSGGLFTVTLDFGVNVFPGAARWLGIGVRPGGSGLAYTVLSPRQPVTATPYAITANAITGPIDGGLIKAGTITSTQLSPDAGGVPSGGLVLSTTENNALLNAGYVRIGTTTTADSWQQRINGSSPSTRTDHVGVWTGSEMIVWGGLTKYINGIALDDGGRYNPASNTWTSMPTIGTPTARHAATAVWTGTEMIVWGGDGSGGSFNDGGRYNPATNAWAPVTTTGAPGARDGHTAVWTGSEMIVWGGYTAGNVTNDGGRYNPASNVWGSVALTGAPTARWYHTAVWTGTEMIVWAGTDTTGIVYGDGARYSPASNSWTSVSSGGAPAARAFHKAIWTGSEMIVWGGHNNHTPYFNDGGRYNPASNTWTGMSTAGAPSGRAGHTAVWTGSQMIVWGGHDGSAFLNTGARYTPATNSWLPTATTGSPSARDDHTAVWTGGEMIVWGGENTNGANSLSDGGRYNPATNAWTAIIPPTYIPAPRQRHTAVWTGAR